MYSIIFISGEFQKFKLDSLNGKWNQSCLDFRQEVSVTNLKL